VKLAVLAGLLLATIAVMFNWQLCVFHVVCFFSKPYDKDFYAKNYQVEDGKIYIVDSKAGKRYPIKRFFSDGFENAAGIRDLIGLERGWTSFTLQSPGSPTVTDYNNLQARILRGECGFLDNRVEPSSEHAHSGRQSLKTLSVAPGSYHDCTKASLSTTLLHFVKGDDVWFSGWYYVEKGGESNTLLDLETKFARGSPGMRICLIHGHVSFQLAKWADNPRYRQTAWPQTPFPMNRWVQIKARLRLSEAEDGIIQLWQDGSLIIDQRGQTLPFADVVYNSMEIGLSAHSASSDSAVLYVDDVVISANPIEDPDRSDRPIESNAPPD
jgi:hypothetical protein